MSIQLGILQKEKRLLRALKTPVKVNLFSDREKKSSFIKSNCNLFTEILRTERRGQTIIPYNEVIRITKRVPGMSMV